MHQFQCDYTGGCLPEVFEALAKTNNDVLPGYCEDDCCKKAEKLILEASQLPSGRVFWVMSGTLANLVTLSAMLPAYGAVVCAESGHIATAEAAAIEATGHKVVTLESFDGKLNSARLDDFCEHFNSCSEIDRAHLVRPAVVYISFPTETGTVYSRDELEAIAAVCRKWKMPLYLDGARLAYGLACSDVTLSDIARLTDAFYIGGTKCGALAGEAIVVKNAALQQDFLGNIRMRGALIAKGRLVGCAFTALFEDGLYLRLGREAVEKAATIRKAFADVGIQLVGNSVSNQVFVRVNRHQAQRLGKTCRYKTMHVNSDDTMTLRLCTSWSTTENDVIALLQAIKEL